MDKKQKTSCVSLDMKTVKKVREIAEKERQKTGYDLSLCKVTGMLIDIGILEYLKDKK